MLKRSKYQYDKIRLESISYGDQEISYQDYPDGMLQSVCYPLLSDSSLIRTEYDYNALNQLTSITNYKNDQILSSYQYSYDDNGNIATITSNGETTSYRYNDLNRLNLIIRPDESIIIYTYDARGNRKTSSWGISPQICNSHYQYTQLDQLTQVSQEGQTYSFNYDPSELRIKKTTPDGTTYYIYDQAGRLIAEADDNNNITANYIWGPERVIIKNAHFSRVEGHLSKSRIRMAKRGRSKQVVV